MKWMLAATLLMLQLGTVDAATSKPDIVYLNRCATGCPVSPGADDAINAHSSVIASGATLAAFPGSDATFDSLAACVRHVLLPFNVHVIASNPGAIARREIMISTTSGQVGFSNLPSLAPYDGNPHDNTIAFIFANSISTTNADLLCQYVAQDVALLYALDYVANCPDIMDTAVSCGEKSFLNQASVCSGTLSGSIGHCFDGSTTQNSYAKMLATAGASKFLFVNSFEGFELPRAGPSP